MERNLWIPASLQALSGELLHKLLSQGKGSTGKFGKYKKPFAPADIMLQHHLNILPSHAGLETQQGLVALDTTTSVPLL